MKEYITNWAFKVRYSFFSPICKKTVEYISCFFALFGGYYSLGEMEFTVWKSQKLIDIMREHIIVFLLCVVCITIILKYEKLEHMEHLGEQDTVIRLKIGDILNIKDSAIVIPTNTTFDTTMNDCFISEKSIQGKFQKKMYGMDFSKLDAEIKQSLDDCYADDFEILTDRIKTNRNRYKIGTVAKVTVKNQHFYFLAVADVSKSGKTENVTMESMTQALVGMWEYLSKNGHTEPITIPVIGTGRAGLRDGTLEDVVQETLFSFMLKSQEEFVSRKMTVCIYPPTLKEANATWENLCDYLDLQCHFFTENQKRVKSSNTIGNVVGG